MLSKTGEFSGPRPLVAPFLADANLLIIYASAGAGKSFLLLFLLLLLTRKNSKGTTIGPLEVVSQVAVTYLDDEMLPQQNQKRISSLIGSLGPKSKEFPFTMLTSDELFNVQGERCNLTREYWRNAISHIQSRLSFNNQHPSLASIICHVGIFYVIINKTSEKAGCFIVKPAREQQRINEVVVSMYWVYTSLP